MTSASLLGLHWSTPKRLSCTSRRDPPLADGAYADPVDSLIVQAVELAGLVAVSIYGASRIRTDRRLPARAGPTGLEFTLGSRTALVTFPLMGAVVVAGSALANDDTLALLGIGALAFLLFAQITTISRARRS
jgi:hypothetical protein